jgi:Na+/H+ antiporter NhaD/arsenite permease-like protein
MDNVLAIATLIPVVRELESLGVEVFPLWWGMLFAGTFLGNLTMIGSTANIVAIGMMERRALGHISMLEWVKAAAIPSLVTLALASGLIYLQLLR